MATSLGDLPTAVEARAMDNQTLALARLKVSFMTNILSSIDNGVQEFTMNVPSQFVAGGTTLLEAEGYTISVTTTSGPYDLMTIKWEAP